MQRTLLARALKFREDNTARADSYDAFKQLMEGRPGFVIAPWCGSADCDGHIKNDTQATIRNMPIGAGPPGAGAFAATTTHRRRRGSRKPTRTQGGTHREAR